MSSPPTRALPGLLLARIVEWLTRRLESQPLPVLHYANQSEVAELGHVVDGHPADDLPLTIRVHPDDDPYSPAARRYIRDDSDKQPWQPILGWPRHAAAAAENCDPEYAVPDLTDEQVARFPRQPYHVVRRVIEDGGRR